MLSGAERMICGLLQMASIGNKRQPAPVSLPERNKGQLYSSTMFVIAGDVGRTREPNSNSTNEVWFSTNGVDWKKGR